MMLGGTPGEVNPNSSWLNSRGMWLSYSTGVLVLHLALLSIPFTSVAWDWTLTNTIHNAVCLFSSFGRTLIRLRQTIATRVMFAEQFEA